MALYKSLCLELDALLIDIMEGCEQKIATTLLIEKHMDHGFVNIAKTRYINGSNSVTSLQLPTELSNPMEPIVTVTRLENDGKVFVSLTKPLETPATNDGVRKRKENSEKVSPTESNPTVTDPIRLFGVLVPQSLKLSQKSFKEVVELVASAAQTQIALEKNIERFHRLKNIKEQMTS